MAYQAKGEQGHIIMKMNALVDKPMISLLYEASQGGGKDRFNCPEYLLFAPRVLKALAKISV